MKEIRGEKKHERHTNKLNKSVVKKSKENTFYFLRIAAPKIEF